MIVVPPLRSGVCVFAAVLGLLLCPPLAAQPPAHDIVLVFDNSGSMKANDPGYLARKAARTFVESLSGDVRMAVIIFDQTVRLAAPLTPLDDGTRAAVEAGLAQVDYKGQFTQTAAALERALYELKANGRDGVRRSVVVFTDGIVDTNDKARDLESIKWMRDDLAAEAAELGIRVYGIAFTENADVMTIQTLAKRTGAEYYRAPQPADLADVFAQLRDVLQAPEPVPVPAPEPTTAGAVPAPNADGDVAPAASPAAPGGDAALPRATGAAVATAPDTQAAPPGAAGGAPDSPSAVVADPPLAPVAVQETAAAQAPASASVAEPAATGTAGARDAGATDSAPVPEPPAAGGALPWWIVAAVAVGLLVSVIALVLVVRRSRAPVPAAVPAPSPSPAPSAGTLVIPQGATLDDLGRVTGQSEHPLDRRLTIVGRIENPSTDGQTRSIVIDRTTIGRQHAIIEYRGNGFWIRDHKSLNGTYVNGQRLGDAEVLLKGGDQIRFYDVEFRFAVAGQDAMNRTVLAGVAHDPDRTVMAAPGAGVAAAAAAALAGSPRGVPGAEESTVIFEHGNPADGSGDAPPDTDSGAVAPAGAPEADEASLATMVFDAGDIMDQAADEPLDLVLDAGDSAAGDVMFDPSKPELEAASGDAEGDVYADMLILDAGDGAGEPPTATPDTGSDDAGEQLATMMFDAGAGQPPEPDGGGDEEAGEEQLATMMFDAGAGQPPEADGGGDEEPGEEQLATMMFDAGAGQPPEADGGGDEEPGEEQLATMMFDAGAGQPSEPDGGGDEEPGEEQLATMMFDAGELPPPEDHMATMLFDAGDAQAPAAEDSVDDDATRKAGDSKKKR